MVLSQSDINELKKVLEESKVKQKEQTPEPKGLKKDVQLKKYQREGLTWLIWRESQPSSGGILADDMGLGKTLSTISLIVHQKNQEKSVKYKHDTLIPSNTTLIIAKKSITHQWLEQITKFTEKGLLKTYIYESDRTKTRVRDPELLAQYDIVITSIELIAGEISGRFSKNEGSPWKSIAWRRIVIDEAHNIKNQNTEKAKSLCMLEAQSRWCLTGTPIQNTHMDLFSLIKFLRVKKFSDVTTWTALVGATDPKEIEISKEASSKLNILVQCLMLRRLKTDMDSETKEKILELPENMFEPVDIHMQGLEKEAYDIYLNYNQEKVLQEISGENRQLENQPKMTTKKGISCILELLLRQRQSCNHFYLVSDVIDMENMPKLKDKKYVDIFSQNYQSAKLRELLKRIDFIVTVAKDKCVVMTEWRGMLNIIINHLNKLKFKYDVISGDVPAEKRQEIVRAFNEPVKKDENGSVLLLTLKTGDVGLNLIGGNHIFIYEMPWNPAIEQQACDRVYRIGQTKPVYTYKFVVYDTVEEKILEKQNLKKALASSILEGPISKEPKNSKEDLLEIFGLTKVRKN